ncbi:MAG: hypothetical protein ACLQVJ_17390 [Syntrophobacteraceae bacterium]
MSAIEIMIVAMLGNLVVLHLLNFLSVVPARPTVLLGHLSTRCPTNVIGDEEGRNALLHLHRFFDGKAYIQLSPNMEDYKADP